MAVRQHEHLRFHPKHFVLDLMQFSVASTKPFLAARRCRRRSRRNDSYHEYSSCLSCFKHERPHRVACLCRRVTLSIVGDRTWGSNRSKLVQKFRVPPNPQCCVKTSTLGRGWQTRNRVKELYLTRAEFLLLPTVSAGHVRGFTSSTWSSETVLFFESRLDSVSEFYLFR